MKQLPLLTLLILISCKQEVKDKNATETKVQKLEPIEQEVENQETNQIPIQENSSLRPNEPLYLNTTYTDTLEFIDYNDDYDYRFLIGLKNNKEASLAYNWDWFANEEYNFIQGDIIAVQWKMDSIIMPGDRESVAIAEMALDAKKIASGKQPIQFLKREDAYDESVQATISTIIINQSYLQNITLQEKAALAYVAFDIGNECEWGYDSEGNGRVLWCQIVSALNLDHQCSEKQLSFLRKWFSKDTVAQKKLESCPTLPNTATVQTTLDEILLKKDEPRKTITVQYTVTGINTRASESWHYTQTDVFEYGSEHIVLVNSKKSDLTKEKTNMNPDDPENIDPQNFVLALKDHILDEWEEQDKFDSFKITFTDNVLNIKGEEGFTLSTYDFNEMVINGTSDSQTLYLTVTNEGGGAGGNVMLEETYSLTVMDVEDFDIRHVETRLAN